MVSPYFLWAVGVGFAPKPTHWSFHLRWQISLLGCSLFLHCSSVKLEVVATGLDPMRPGGIYKMALHVRLYNEPVQPCTWSVYGCRKATEVRQLHDCATCYPANFNFLGFPSLSCNLFCFHEFVFNIFDTYDSLSCMLCDPRYFLQLHVNFLFYFHGNSNIKANPIIRHLGKTASFQSPSFDIQHTWQVSSCNVGGCGGLRSSFFRHLLALWLSSVIRKA